MTHELNTFRDKVRVFSVSTLSSGPSGNGLGHSYWVRPERPPSPSRTLTESPSSDRTGLDQVG